MTGRIYVLTFEGVAATAAQDLFEITPASNKPVILHALILSQSSDVGDAAEEGLRVQILRGHTTGGSGGSAFTAIPMGSSAGAAAGFSAEINNTTIASAGTAVSLHAEAFNIRSGMQVWWTPETRPGASAANTTIVVRLMAAPADSLTMSGTLIVEEV